MPNGWELAVQKAHTHTHTPACRRILALLSCFEACEASKPKNASNACWSLIKNCATREKIKTNRVDHMWHLAKLEPVCFAALYPHIGHSFATGKLGLIKNLHLALDRPVTPLYHQNRRWVLQWLLLLSSSLDSCCKTSLMTPVYL